MRPAMSEEPKNPLEQSRLKLLIDSVVDYAIYMIDPEGVVSSWNAGAARIKGYTEAEILGANFSCFYTPEDRRNGLPQRALRTAVEEGRFEGEGWRLRKDGTPFWSHVVIDPIRSPEGTLLGFAKITRDLTERKAAEETLKQSEQQFRLLVQSVTDYAIYMLDPEGRVSNWNLGAQRIKGYIPHEVVGQHFSLFYTPEDRENGEPQRALEAAIREGRFEKQGWRVRKDGTRFLAHVIIDPIRGETGKLLGFAKITRDISESAQAQRELETAREALFQSQKLQAIGQLSGGIAHDFNNLLTVILGNLELLRKRAGDDPKVLQLLDNAALGAQRGVSLTQRMLAFARRQELKAESVALPRLLENITGLLRSSLGHLVTIQCDLPPDLPPIQADVNQLELAILNLATNARDAMPQGGRILIQAVDSQRARTLPAGLPNKPYVCLSISDNGQGMDDATLAQATDPFFTTKGIGKGTGLGLSMVHGLAEQLGGCLVLKSQSGQGTCAELWLPQALTAASPAVPGAQPEIPTSRRLRVLLVDDDNLVLTSTSLLLEDLGHQVICVTSATEALQVFKKRDDIDLLITDMAMPLMDGAQLAQAIRALRPEFPIILATGFAQRLDGFVAHLPRLAKPFNQLGLMEVLNKAMG